MPRRPTLLARRWFWIGKHFEGRPPTQLHSRPVPLFGTIVEKGAAATCQKLASFGIACGAALRHDYGMGRQLENRSLDRGLAILNSLSIHGASSLRDLHVRTRLPKSTIRRILGTLVRRKIVRRSLSDQLYRANIYLPTLNSRFPPNEAALVDRALPHMVQLTRSIGWSCDLHIFERTRSRIIESTRPLSPYFQYERHIDLEVSVFASAGGLAVLSTWEEAAVLALVSEIGDHPVWGLSRLGLTARDLLATLRHARATGYAVRSSRFRSETPLANRMQAIACPIFREEVSLGALAVLWTKGSLEPAEFAEAHLNALKQAAALISADLSRQDLGAAEGEPATKPALIKPASARGAGGGARQ
jgi:IclR family mhp operon transcriptional activator